LTYGRNNIRAITDQNDFTAVGDRDTRLPRTLDRDLARSRVVIDEVELLVGRHDKVGINPARTGQFEVHVTGNARSTVRNGNRGVRAYGNDLSYITRNSLFKERTQVTVGGDTPRAGLLARANQFKTKVRAVSSHFVPLGVPFVIVWVNKRPSC
jgi:hypothetical protein